MSMFCFQCEQRAGGTGCTVRGVCGKTPDTAALQDLLVSITKGIGQYTYRAYQRGYTDPEIDRFIIQALFTTVTNVNFDPERLTQVIHQAGTIRDRAQKLYEGALKTKAKPADPLSRYTQLDTTGDTAELTQLAEAETIAKRLQNLGPDITGLQELILYGLKGAAAYADHASILGVQDSMAYGEFAQVLDFLAGDPKDIDALVQAALKVGSLNMKVMELLDKANTDAYGHPEPTTVRVTPVKGKCILVSGHDLKDLAELLKQTEGKGINVYTHGEMLPCLAYPGLKKYKHLVGNYGGAWQDQAKEFDAFPGAILMTTNCIQKPKETYNDRIFTCGLVAFPGVKHIADRDFSPVIKAAQQAEGFTEDAPAKTITIGFARNAVMSVAGKVVDAVKAGQIRHFFLVGGCDGAKPGRNYFTEFAEQVPDDCVILTLACGKYRFNKLEFGDIGGIPRLLDIGQCNDAYSAVQIALALSKAFGVEVNDLPLSLIISWYEQKAVAILLTLLFLGIKNIRLGPTLPAFIGPEVLKVLVENFNIMPTTNAQDDLKAILGN